MLAEGRGVHGVAQIQKKFFLIKIPNVGTLRRCPKNLRIISATRGRGEKEKKTKGRKKCRARRG
jgi:hypothetical protein